MPHDIRDQYAQPPGYVTGGSNSGTGGVGSTGALDNLSDVVITTPADGHFVRYNGTNFVNQALSESDIPGADTADAGQVPTSDGAGGFTWEDQAGGTPTTDAGDLTSGTLAAARLPGVLVNVDTAAELRAAAQLDTTDSPQFASIQLGHASDTTITRTGAGVIAVEGVEITTNSGTQSLTNKTLGGDLLTSTAIRIGPNTADASDNSSIVFGHSGLTRGGGITCCGNEHATLPGRVIIQPGYNGSACQFQVLAFNGAEMLGANGVSGLVTTSFGLTVTGGNLTYSGSGSMQWTATGSSAGSSVACAYKDSTGNIIFNVNTSSAVQFGAGNYVTVGINDRGIGFTQDCNLMSAAVGIARYATGLVLQTTTVGCINQQAKLQTRANSTAYSICSHVTNDISRIIIQDSLGRRAVALIDGSGTVTFESGSHADYVASSSPASGEVGIYVASPGASGVATAKPGSAATRGIAFWPFRGIA